MLTIAVPTYNRPNELSYLYGKFLSRAMRDFPGEVEIVVCDNSDPEIAGLNAKVLGKDVRHVVNGNNLGYAGNVIQCFRKARGDALWLLCDNDEVLYSGFQQLMAAMRDAALRHIEVFMLPFHATTWNGEEIVSNCLPRGLSTDNVTLSSLVPATQSAPFILLSSAVIRPTSRWTSEMIDLIEQRWVNNDFIQIPLYTSLLKPSSRISFISQPVLAYSTERIRRFGLTAMERSLYDVFRYMEEHGIDICAAEAKMRRGWMIAYIQNALGLLSIPGTDTFRRRALKATLIHPTPKDMALLLAMFLPPWLLSWPVALWLTKPQSLEMSRDSIGHWIAMARGLRATTKP